MPHLVKPPISVEMGPLKWYPSFCESPEKRICNPESRPTSSPGYAQGVGLWHVSYSLNFLKGIIEGDYIGIVEEKMEATI